MMQQEEKVSTEWATPQPEEKPKPAWGLPRWSSRVPVWAAKLLFFVYIGFCVGCWSVAPVGLLVFVPSVLLMADYVRKDRKLRDLTGWRVEPEVRDSAGEGRAGA